MEVLIIIYLFFSLGICYSKDNCSIKFNNNTLYNTTANIGGFNNN